MSIEMDHNGMFSRYLLGMSDHGEQTLIEERLLRDTNFYQELLIAEDELVDQYLANELSHAERDHFEKNFLVTPERMLKLRFARSLGKYISEAANSGSAEGLAPGFSDQVKASASRPLFGFQPLQNPFARYAFAALVLLAIGGGLWFAIKSTQTTITTGQRVLAVTLTPGLTRGSSGPTGDIQLPKDVEVLQLHLALTPNEYQRYQAELLREGRILRVEEDLKPETATGQSLILSVDARSLTAGDYQVKLSGRLPDQSHEKLQSYHFRILRTDPVK